MATTTASAANREEGSVLRSLRTSFNGFIQHHAMAWELGMAVLAVVYVLIGFASDQATAAFQPVLASADFVLTIVFIGEFATRFLASFNRLRYLRDHALDLVALLPVARGLRVARLVRLLRLVRTFTGLRRVFTSVDRLANHHELGTLVIAWFGTMFLCSTVFYTVESDVNPALRDAGDAVWWGIATLTGGTADVHAVTTEGRIATAALLILGVALFTAITAVLVSFIVSSAPATTTTDPILDIERLAALARDGAITSTEYESKRVALLARI
jgi:voltage-gated potassium channel